MSCDIRFEQLWSWVDRSAPELDEHVVGCHQCRRHAKLLRQQTEALKQEALIPESIGPYKLTGIIGQGGMGIVYRAVQPGTERHVAVKVMWDAFEGQRRFAQYFEREVRALGRLSHPNIARVYESSQTEQGRRFLVMELIEGVPIDRFARFGNSSRPDLLRLFASICDAIAHAHDRGVLHRDIKPSNVLVTAEPAARVLDFGLARFTDARNTDEHTAVAPACWTGTLPYISPERLKHGSERPTAQSDVYSLGVMLYELLLGQLPFQVSNSQKETLDAVYRGDYARPMYLDQTIGRDLNTIIETAMQVDPQQRYASAAHLRDDLIRYLTHRPIHARSRGHFYRAGKAIRRNCLAFTIAGLVFAVLLTSSIVSTSLFIRARRATELASTRLQLLGEARDNAVAESRRYKTELQKSQRLCETLSRTFDLAQPLGYKPGRLTHDALSDEIASTVDRQLKEFPAVAASLHAAIGQSILYRSGRDSAELHFKKSLELRLAHDPYDALLIGDGHFDLGSYYLDSGCYTESVPHFLEAISCYRRTPNGDDCTLARAEASYGAALIATDQVEQGIRIAEDAIDRLRASLCDASKIARAYESLAYGYEHIGRYRDALLAMERSVLLHRISDELPDLARTLTALARYAHWVGEPDIAETHLHEAISASHALVGMSNPLLAHQYAQLCSIAVKSNDLVGAQHLAERAVMLGRGIPDQYNRKDHFASKLAGLAWIRGDYNEAERVFRDALRKITREYGPDSDECISSTITLGVVLRDKGEFAEAETLLRKSYENRVRAYGQGHNKTARVANNLSRLMFLMGDHVESEQLARHALAIRESMYGPDHADVAESCLILGMSLTRLGELVEARQHIERALAIRVAFYPKRHFLIAEARSAFGELLLQEGACSESRQILEDAHRLLCETLEKSHRYIKLTRERIAMLETCVPTNARREQFVSGQAMTPGAEFENWRRNHGAYTDKSDGHIGRLFIDARGELDERLEATRRSASDSIRSRNPTVLLCAPAGH